jgi:endonuclease-8
MPEGDTIHRTARALDGALRGRVIRSCRGREVAAASPSVVGARVEGARALGKNLLLGFALDTTLVSHMGMTGSWHLYRPGERWQKPEARASLVVETDDVVAVAFSVPTLEWLRTRELPLHPRLASLGPDLLDADFDVEEALRRLRVDPHLDVGEAILDQRIVAGIGNVYKSEGLFLAGIDPFAPIRRLGDEDLRRLLEGTRCLMHANLDGFPRTTCPEAGRGATWVYDRSGRPCRRCRTPIRMRRQGLAGRSTWFCTTCARTA